MFTGKFESKIKVFFTPLFSACLVNLVNKRTPQSLTMRLPIVFASLLLAKNASALFGRKKLASEFLKFANGEKINEDVAERFNNQAEILNLHTSKEWRKHLLSLDILPIKLRKMNVCINSCEEADEKMDWRGIECLCDKD